MNRNQFKNLLKSKSTNQIKMNLASVISKMQTATKGSKETWLLKSHANLLADELMNGRGHYVALTEAVVKMIATVK